MVFQFTCLCVALGANVTAHRMTNNPDASLCGILLPPKVNIFDARTDYAACLYYVIEDVAAGDEEKAIWYYEGRKYYESKPSVYEEAGDFCATENLIIKGYEMECMTGNWAVEYYLNGSKEFTETFYLEGLDCGPTCLAEYVLDGDEASLKTLRTFRDTVLSKTNKGKKLIDFYYAYSPLAIDLIKNNPKAKELLRKKINTLMPVIKNLLDKSTK
jgi:hypothetical protein